ncbi:hypothetical protein PPYR_01327 [Photinus pyralis]|uniref:Ig-like domain-containing protein n=1 Tax=Photinus pyralis TaxID=7054 RepID=A0A5N4B415_PHOPY|nr:uncharacterized protein LOC116177822 isoform X2 [Photinus pyralis]KAB0804357.1 hypothetical protein PPYR_01327 [Photinus pyralis]
MWRRLLIYCFIMLPQAIRAVQINYIKVPSAVQNDSEHSIILECNYSLRPDDAGLVVKWFLNDAVVYQWIPPKEPQALGVMKGKLNLDYVSSNDPKMMYRSMNIINPTTELAGEYKCTVSTFTDEDFSLKNMIVFVPETSLELSHSGFSNKQINFTCTASEVYPEPKLIIFKDVKDEYHDRKYLDAVEWSTSRLPSGRFSLTTTTSVLLDTISPGSLVHCDLKIPGTGYVKRKTMLYYPINSTITQQKNRLWKICVFCLAISLLN